MTLEELKAIIAKATPWPWMPGSFEDTGFKNQVSISPSIGAAYGAKDEAESNATLIATSRTALPAALALIEQMALKLDEAKCTFAQYKEAHKAKGTPDGEEKAFRNALHEISMLEALAAYEAFKKNVNGG